MARMNPLKDEELPPEIIENSKIFEKRMGFRANSGRTMARSPKLVKALGGLAKAVYEPSDSVPLSLRNMIAHMASQSAGCMYCAAHTASNALRPGSELDEEKLANIWDYENSPLFSDKERAALRFSQGAAAVPNAVTDKDFEEMYKHFSEVDVVEILALIGYFGFLNRWNDTMATDLEDLPKSVSESHLERSGWNIGKHGG
jgi:uncharacterized peroxidase-related enzyme